jgi:hypothetical protein
VVVRDSSWAPPVLALPLSVATRPIPAGEELVHVPVRKPVPVGKPVPVRRARARASTQSQCNQRARARQRVCAPAASESRTAAKCSEESPQDEARTQILFIHM